MNCRIILMRTAMLVGLVAVASGQVIKTVTGTAGQSITLNSGVTGVHADDHIIWSYGSQQRVLLNFDDGKLVWNESRRYQLDPNTGSLTVHHLSTSDGGLYQLQIMNGKGSTHKFNLTVVESDPTQTPDGGSNKPAPNKILIIWMPVVLSVVLSVVLALVIGLIVYAVKNKKAKCCFSACRSNGVV